ncbi:MAG: hypothetical protein Q4A75_05490 [Peptostreptococcaceae bacterium]|nr:hypothetical protein [Peptostreptococcaceae bacterium]
MITVENDFYYINPHIEQILLNDGTILDRKTINEQASLTRQTNSNDALTKSDGTNRSSGYDGEDTIKIGHRESNNTYFNQRDGSNRIQDTDYRDDPNTNHPVFGENMLNLLFEKQGRNMRVSMANIDDRSTIEDWNFGKKQIETCYTSDNKSLHSYRVDLLIQSMAAYSQENAMSWNQSVNEKNEEVQRIYEQFWTGE